MSYPLEVFGSICLSLPGEGRVKVWGERLANFKSRTFLLVGLLGLFGCQIALGQGVDVVGRLSAFKSAKLSTRPTSNGTYSEPSSNQVVHNGDGLRTERRGFAQINFNDKSALRLSELTELIVQDSLSLRRLQLAKGAIWIRVTKGSNTSVQTPIATATVKGTEFLFDEFGNLAVREGIVELQANGFTIEVGPGEVGGVGADGKPYKKSVHITTNDEADIEVNGVPDSWWKTLKADRSGPDHNEFLALLILPFLFMGDHSSHSNSSTPEPATVAVLAIGAGMLLNAKRKVDPNSRK
jgi:hypothetical protein